MEIKSESVKIIFEGERIVGFYHNNGHLTLYKAEVAAYTDIEDLLNNKKKQEI